MNHVTTTTGQKNQLIPMNIHLVQGGVFGGTAHKRFFLFLFVLVNKSELALTTLSSTSNALTVRTENKYLSKSQMNGC